MSRAINAVLWSLRPATVPLQLVSDVLYEIALIVDLAILVIDGTDPTTEV